MIGIFLICSLLVSIACYFIFKISNVLHLVLVAAGSLLATLMISLAASYVSTSSVEIINGQVTGKERDWVSCSHSYSCNCRTVTTGSGENQTSTTVCDTCYDHDNDWDWDVKTTIGRFTIDRVDRRGEKEPERWTEVNIGDPVSKGRSYQNWIKSSKSSLFNNELAKDDPRLATLPKYPGKIYDYYKINRIVSPGLRINNVDVHEQYLSNHLRTLSPAKQVNLIFVVTKEPNTIYADHVYSAWGGAEKNDVVVFVGIDGGKINWAVVKAWSKYDIFQVTLRDELLALPSFNMKSVIDKTVEVTASKFERKPMSDFEYLKDDASGMSMTVMIVISLIVLLINIGGCFLIKDYERSIRNSYAYNYRNSRSFKNWRKNFRRKY